jgi:hypothetical protein
MTIFGRTVRLQGIRRRDGHRIERFLAKAEVCATDGQPWAIAVASVSALESLTREKAKGAMESMRLYLEGFVEGGEFFERIGRYDYGLMLRCGDEAAFQRRLEILRQDSRYLYMAAYPGRNICARVAACRVAGAPSAGEALRLAQEQNVTADESRN